MPDARLVETDMGFCGALRQSSAGIYSLLPFGQRVLEKLEQIIEHEMYSLGASGQEYEMFEESAFCLMALPICCHFPLADASKVSLPNLLPPTLWKRSGRWESTGNEARSSSSASL